MHRTRRALLTSLLAALTASFGYVLAGVPNVELMTVTVFVGGYLLGARLGAVIGVASSALFFIFNPFGPSPPPVLAAQVTCFALTGLAGALLGPLVLRSGKRTAAMAFAGLTGFALTLLYDVLTNMGGFLLVTGERTLSNLWKYVAAGVGFTVMHLVWNTGIFLATLRPMLNVLARYRHEIS